MKIKYHMIMLTSILSILVAWSTPVQDTSAHESRLYSIGDKDYWITVGSINELVFVSRFRSAHAHITS